MLTRRYAPAVLGNTEGEPLVTCETTLLVADPAALERALDEEYDRVEEDAWVENAPTTKSGRPVIRAMLRLAGDQLIVTANSEPRMDRVLAALSAAQPAIAVTSESRKPTNTLEALAEQTSDVDEDESSDPPTPELAAVLDQFILDYEQRLLDQPIPALAGYTPRQCAAEPHPTPRPDPPDRLVPHRQGQSGHDAAAPTPCRARPGVVPANDDQWASFWPVWKNWVTAAVSPSSVSERAAPNDMFQNLPGRHSCGPT
ncbi:MAG TPA: hypothetical protein VH333_26565 [Pseudonocardiaceae bacterium]|jgi:hypothetical protein|nr:hypothetical protein [Pseudonocardiaceae bacterium]